MKKKTIDLTENMELAQNTTGCAVLLEIALAEPSTNKFNVSVMRAAKFAVLTGAARHKDTTEAISLLLKTVYSESRNNVSISKKQADEFSKSLKNIADEIEEGVKINGNLI